MRTRDRRPALSSRLRPLAVALAFAAGSGEVGAVTSYAPGSVPRPASGGMTREDGTPLRVALRAWHEDAAQNLVPPSPHGIVRQVSNCNDDGPGSLRNVLQATASGDTVDLTRLGCSRISLTTGAIAAHIDTVTLEGPPSRDLTIDGNNADRVFLHYGAGGLLLRNITITRGRHSASGTNVGIAGCLASAGYVTLDHSKVTGCFAGGEGAYGGGIYAYSLILASSTLSANEAYGTHPDNGTAAFGGGAFVYQVDIVDSTVSNNVARHRSNPSLTSYDIGAGILTVRGGLVIDSTIDSNVAGDRGGGLATFTDILVRNSTISGNVAGTVGGGGLFVRFPAGLDVRNSTITANRAPDGGGVFMTSQNASLLSTIVAGNSADPRGVADFAGTRSLTIAGSNNLIGSTSSVVAIPADSVTGDPGLMPLAYNGGATRTHALRSDSPGIDAGNNDTDLPSDQRGDGYPRVIGASADIGAFEYNDVSPAGSPRAVSVPALAGWACGVLLTLMSIAGARAAFRTRRRA